MEIEWLYCIQEKNFLYSWRKVDGMFGENLNLFYIFPSGEDMDLIIMANLNFL
jgi:hypothetical protein